jgi:hypothetical protein
MPNAPMIMRRINAAEIVPAMTPVLGKRRIMASYSPVCHCVQEETYGEGGSFVLSDPGTGGDAAALVPVISNVKGWIPGPRTVN